LILTQKKIKIAFVNPPHADWSLANNMTYLMMQSHYNHVGKYSNNVDWLTPPYKFNQYKTINDIFNEIKNADIYLFSSYVWNYDICDELASLIKKTYPNALCVVGGPHIGTNEQEFLQSRNMYDFVCAPTKPGEVFMEDLINEYIETDGDPKQENISWELRSQKRTSCGMPTYSVYEEHFDYLKETCDYAKKYKLEPFILLETTRGCPYKCVFCEWGGGTDTKILKKELDIVKQDILAMKRAGYRDAYLTDANFGAFEDRDIEIFEFAWRNDFCLTDISTLKAQNLDRRKRLIDRWFSVVGATDKKNNQDIAGKDMWEETRYMSIVPTVSIQSISEEAMRVAKRVDLSTEGKLELSRHIEKRCREEGFPVPALELILGMPGSTIDDFYNEMEVIWNFKAWGSTRHDYMFLPDSHLSDPEYIKQYKIKTVKVYTDLVDEDGVDNWQGLYKNKKNYFYTIQSCYSYTKEEMYEMWFMNHAGNKLLEEIYPNFQQNFSPAEFGKHCYSIMKQLPGFNNINKYIVDLLDPTTETKSIKRIHNQLRTQVMNDFVDHAKPIINSELFVIAEKKDVRCRETIC